MKRRPGRAQVGLRSSILLLLLAMSIALIDSLTRESNLAVNPRTDRQRAPVDESAAGGDDKRPSSELTREHVAIEHGRDGVPDHTAPGTSVPAAIATDDWIEFEVQGSVRSRLGSPLAGAKVAVATTAGEVDTVTDPSGGYSLHVCWPIGSGYVPVVAVMNGYRACERQLQAWTILERPGRVVCDLTLDSGTTITGRVSCGSRLAVGAAVSFDWPDGKKKFWTNARGVFFAGVSHAATTTAIRFGHGELGCATRYVHSTADATMDLGDIELSPSNTPLTGRLVFADGQAIAGFEVRCTCQRGAQDAMSGCSTWSTVTDEGGAILLSGMAAPSGGIKVFGIAPTQQLVVGGGKETVVMGVRVRLVGRLASRRVPPVELAVKWKSTGSSVGPMILGNGSDRIVGFGTSWLVVITHAGTGKTASTTIDVPVGASSNEIVKEFELR